MCLLLTRDTNLGRWTTMQLYQAQKLEDVIALELYLKSSGNDGTISD